MYTLFRGHTDDGPINPDADTKRVSLSLVDSLADFRGINVTTALWQGLRTGEAIGKVLDAAGWTGGRDIDVGSTIIPWWWVDGRDAFTALQEILAAEGPPALLTIDVNGGLVFRDRQHRLIRTASKVSQATFVGRDNLPEPIMTKGYAYNDAWMNVVNSVAFSIEDRQPTGDLVQVWSTEETFSIAASASVVVVLQASDPFQAAVTPVQDTDYTIVSGGVASVTLSRTSGQSTSITVTATGAGAYIQGMALRAYSVPVVRTYQITATDSGSITDYGQRGVPSGSEPSWASRYDAQAIADLFILQRKQPLPILTVRFNAGNLQANRLTKVLALDLSDRVTVIEPETQVSNDFYVESISHAGTMTEHEVVFGLELVPAAPTGVFIIGTSTLNGSDVLGY